MNRTNSFALRTSLLSPATRRSVRHFEPSRSWVRNLSLLLVGLIAPCIFPSSASAQFAVVTGTPPFGSFSGTPDIVDLGNNNAHLAIPVLHKAGRGQNFQFDITHDSSVWFPVTANGSQFWSSVASYGWQGIFNNASGYITFQELFITAPCNPPSNLTPNTISIYTFFTYVDQSGTAHSFSGAVPGSQSGSPGCSTPAPPPSSFTATANDGSGYTLSASNSAGLQTILYSNDGKTLNVPINPAGSAQSWSIADRNGNVINGTSAGQYFDTISAVLTQNLVYTAPSGGTAQYVGKFTTYPIQTNFGCGGITEFGANGQATASLVSEIDLPDYNPNTNPNSRYTFTYEQTPGHSGFVTGRLASITLPTGGTITYSYSGGSNGIICSDGSTATLTRVVNDGTNSDTWIYARSQISGNHWRTFITDPTNNQTVIDFQEDSSTNPATYNFYETQRNVYQGSTSGTLLQTINTCYNGASSPCTGTSVSSPITQKSVVTILPGPQNLQSRNSTFFDAHGNVTEIDEYDFGSGVPPSTPLRKTLITYASLGNNINNMLSSLVVQDGSGSVTAKTTYAYDETSVVTTSGTPQHNSVTGSRGNLTTLNTYTGVSSYLTKKMTYFDTGNVQTLTDVNNGQTTYTYGACGNSFPTSVTEAVSGLSQSMTWNCTGGVQLTSRDENGATTTTAYTDAYFWRPASVTDPSNVVTNASYNSPASIESTLTINSNSLVDTLTTLDGLGRNRLRQKRQAPGSANFDTQEQDYDGIGRPSRSTLPYTGTAGQTNTTAPAISTTFDTLGRPLTVTDASNGAVTYSYEQNDVLVTVGPAPAGENAKRRQLEYDGLGRLTSVCEITSAAGNGTCGQTVSQTGFWTKYTYDLNNNLISVTQNAQAAAGSQQTRNYTFDFLNRLTSEANPENGTTTYTYDSASGCTGTYSGDLVMKVDAVGNVACFTYDGLHRKLSATYPSGTYAPVTPSKYFVYDSATVSGANMNNAQGRLAEAYTCTTCPGTKLTDIGYSYTVRGEVSDIYESTPHSSGYYHTTQSYWPHGLPAQLSGLAGLPSISYGGTTSLDGEGRITQVTASSGQNPVTAVSYNTSSLPTQVTFGSGDSDIFAYDPNTVRMTQFQFKLGGKKSKSLTGALTWNANGTLGQLAITDQFNSSDTQTCTYAHDDLTRIASANCGSAAAQTFSFDPFGNISKSGSPYTFQPGYSAATNRMTSISGFTPTYDNNGNVTNDSNHTYSWDADGNSVTIDSVGLTFDAFDRMVEQNRSGSNTQIVFGPTGDKLALMNGQSLVKAFVPLPGQAVAVYTSSGLDHYRRSDWLGSARLTSSPSRAYVSSLAYAPYGETYASSGSTDPSFTGMNPDTVSTDYDFLFREYSNEGRWPSPDPAGLAADPSNPQSWNRYAYVTNNPLAFVDPAGLDPTCLESPPSGGYNGPGGNGFGMCGPSLFYGYCSAEFQSCVSDGNGGFIGMNGGVPSQSLVQEVCAGLVGQQATCTFRLFPAATPSSGNGSVLWLQAEVFVQALARNFVDEFKPGGCVNTFYHASLSAANPISATPTAAMDTAVATMTFVSPAMRYNAARAYASSRINVLGGQGLIFPQNSIPYNKILKGSRATTLAEGALAYVDAAMAQGLLIELENLSSGGCH